MKAKSESKVQEECPGSAASALPSPLRDGPVKGITFPVDAADALQQARLDAESTVNTVRERLLVADSDLRVHSINRPLSALLRVSIEDVLGRPRMPDREPSMAWARSVCETPAVACPGPRPDLEGSATGWRTGKRREVLDPTAMTRTTGKGPDSMQENTATVFVVDDDAGVRKSLGQLLASIGLPVETFASGPEFLDAIDPDRPGCLVLDLRLKEGSGLDVQDELHRRGVPLPIIVLTGHGNVPDAVRAMRAGAFDFLQKPPPPAALLERIRAAIEHDRIARASACERAAALGRLSVLAPGERDVLALMVAGGASPQVASDLALGMRTTQGCGGGMR